jgi:hypothetical protein
MGVMSHWCKFSFIFWGKYLSKDPIASTADLIFFVENKQKSIQKRHSTFKPRAYEWAA